MKNTLKVLSVRVFGIIAIVAIIGFTMIACNKSGGSSGGGGKSFNSAEELKEYLDKQPVNGPDKPIKVSMGANAPMLPKIAEAINSSGKYVSLNLTGNTLITIPERAFEGCETLVSITIPDSVTSIERGAFYDCNSLVNATIGNGVTSLENTGLKDKDLNISAGNTSFSVQDGVLYNKNKTILISCPVSKTGSFTIPDSVTSIGERAFFSCTSLTSITIQNGVTVIEGNAFNGCDNITSITIPSSVTSIGFNAFSCNKLTSITFQGTISSDKLFYDVSNNGFDMTPFRGDLRAKYLAGGIGTYTTTAPVDYKSIWTKQ